MKRTFVMLLLLPCMARGELVLSVVNGSSETPLGDSLAMGPVLEGDRVTVLLSLRNTGAASVTVTRFNVDHPAFQLNAPSVPFAAVPGVPSAVTLSFGAAAAGNYTANLRLNDRSIALSGTVLPASLLQVTPACPERSARTVDFGVVVRGQSRECAFDVYNGSGGPLAVSLTGAGFAGSGPAAVNAGQTIAYAVRFQPSAAQAYTGTLRIGPLTYTLMGQGANPAVPTPVISFDARPPASAQQRQISARLPSPSPVSGSGTLTMSFFPNPGLPDDSSIAFLNPFARIIPFSIQEGSTEIRLGGQPFAVFQTGTTAGQIRFALGSSQFTFESQPVAALTIPPAPIVLDLSSGARSAFDVQVNLAGYDNTYSTGVMTFTFFDAAGELITAPIQANFTEAFRTFYSSAQAGSAFQAIVKFPVTGDISRIAAVEVELSNAAGLARTAKLNF